MSSVLVKSLKFSRILNGRLSFSATKSFYFNSRHLIKLHEQSPQRNVNYATAATKYNSNEESFGSDFRVSNYQKVKTIDDALSNLDFTIRRSGRVLMKNVKNAFSMITNKEMTSSTHGLYLLRCCKFCYAEPPSKRIEFATQIWNKYQELGIQFDVRHYNALLDVHITNGMNFNPVEILNSMEDNNIEPNKATYVLVMKKYCEDGNINGASEILEHMKEKGLAANEDVFNNLILAHVKNNDFSGAKDMIEVMRSSNLQATADTYTILACGYAKSGNKDEMMKNLAMIPAEESINSYLKVAEDLASSGNHQHIDDVLSMIKYPQEYQHEIVNSVVELIHNGHVNLAYKLAMLSYTPQYEHGLHIFVKQLIKTGRPISEITDYCTKIFKGKLSSQMLFSSATKCAVECERYDCIVPIFKTSSELGNVIRASSFWPLFDFVNDEKSLEGFWMILKQMSEMGVPADFATYCDVIFPMLGAPKPNIVLQNVKSSGQSKETAADALFAHYCNLGNIDYAYLLTETINVKISDRINIEKFLSLYSSLNRDSVEKFLKVLKYMLMDENHIESESFQGKILATMIVQKPRVLEILVEKFDDLSFNQKILHSCEQNLRRIRPFKRGYFSVIDRLRNISSEREMLNKEDLSVEEEENQLKYLQAQNASCKHFLTRRINYHIKTKDLTRASKLLSVYDKLGYPFSPLLHSNLLSLYCLSSDVEKATEMYNILKADYPTFTVDVSKTIEYVTLLVKYQKLDESIEVMKSIKEPYIYAQRDNVVKKVALLNTAVCNCANPEFARTMQELLIPLSKDFKSKKVFLDSVLQFHLQRNDFSAAYEEYQNCLKNHHTPAGLSLFLKKCINQNAKDTLQKVIDLTISYVSKSYALSELCVAFIETRNLEKASAVVESLKDGSDQNIIEDLCMRLKNQNKLHELMSFIYITRPLNHENRENLYCMAIRAYARQKNFDKVLDLYDELKKEIGEPTQKTEYMVQELLTQNNQPVPLAMISDSSFKTNPLIVEATKTFMEYLKADNAEEALKELSGMKKGYIRTLSIETLTDFVDLCLEKKLISDMTQIVHLMSYIIDNAKDVLKPVLEKYAEAGDVNKLIEISRYFPDFSLINVGFSSYFSRAFIISGKQEELLSHLEQRADKKNKLFSSFAMEELVKHPELEDRVFNLAKKYHDSKFFNPMSVLWGLYFAKENYEKADKIFKDFSIFLEMADNVILKTIRRNENIDLAQKFLSVVRSSNVRKRSKQKIYGTTLDVLVLKGLYDEAVALVMESERLNLELNKYYLSTLVTLKTILEKENKPVPFSLPLDVSSGSSSDSDTEKSS